MIPDYFEPIIGYRTWDLCSNGLLCGQAIPVPWVPYAAFEAVCLSLAAHDGGHDPTERVPHIGGDGLTWSPAPVPLCGCGIHAFKTMKQATHRMVTESFGSMSASWSQRPRYRAWGSVALWGTVVEHTEGYRAQFAYPVRVYSERGEIIPRIAALYGVTCGCEPLERPAMFVGDYPVVSGSILKNYFLAPGPRWKMPNYASFVNPVVAPTEKAAGAQILDMSGAKFVVPPNDEQIKRLRGSRYQIQQAAQHMMPPDWRTVMRRAFHIPKEK